MKTVENIDYDENNIYIKTVEVIHLQNEKVFIKNLECHMNKNEIKMKWDWPDFDTNIKYVYSFLVTDPNEQIESYLARNAEKRLIPRSTFSNEWCHVEILKDKQVQYKLFPVFIDKNNVFIYDQTVGNLSNIFYKPITLNVDVKYNYTNFFSGFKIATFKFKDTTKIKELPKDSLMYYKIHLKTMQYICCYPINLKELYESDYKIIVENAYKIQLHCNEKYKDFININYGFVK